MITEDFLYMNEADYERANTISVLDSGFVKLVSHMGGDDSIVQAARTSFGKGTDTPEKDKKLIEYLLKNDHGSPFEMPVYKFSIKLPIFIMRQLIRHRMASVNEYSCRYSPIIKDYYVPLASDIRKQDTINKQGSSGCLLQEEALAAQQIIITSSERAKVQYKRLIDMGVARETARLVMPVNFYTQIYWQLNLRSLFNFLKLRMDSHAQLEIRSYAEAISWFVKHHNPVAYSAFEKYVLHKGEVSDA